MEKRSNSQILKRVSGSSTGNATALEIFRLSKKYIGKKVLDIGAGSGALINLIPNAIGLILLLNVDSLNRWLKNIF